jgi:regulator of protease activity HflC (stomatin/prohibitin superfamily)
MCEGKEKETVIGTCLFCVILTGAILFGVSFDTLEPTQVGIKYNFNLVDIQDNKVYDNGRYYLGVGLHFIKYPINLQNLDFIGTESVRCWSKEGQLLKLDVSMNYRLRRRDVIKIYRRYETGFHLRLKLIALESIKEVSTHYEATDFFNQRPQISEEMRNAIAAKFNTDFTDVELFNLRAIDLPDGFENKIVDKVVKAQEYQTAVNRLAIAQVRAANDVIRGNGDALINETLASANADAELVTENAKATALFHLRDTEAQAYSQLQLALNLTGADLLRFRWAQILDKLQGKTDTDFSYIIGFDAPTLTVH